MCETIHAVSCLTSKQLCEVGSIVVPILQMQKLRLTEVKHPVQAKDSKPGLPASPVSWCPWVDPSRYTMTCFLTKELSLETTVSLNWSHVLATIFQKGLGWQDPNAQCVQLRKMCCFPPHPESVLRSEF